MKNILALLSCFFTYIWVLGILTICTIIAILPYDKIIYFIQLYYSDIFYAQKFDKQFFTFSHYNALKYCLNIYTLFLGFIIFCIFIFLDIIYKKSYCFFYEIYVKIEVGIKKLYDLWYNLSKKQQKVIIFLFSITFLKEVYIAHSLHFSNDEVFSYLYFVEKGFLVNILHYPVPNNHVFFNIICNFLDRFSLPPVIVMRLPSLLLYMISLGICFFLLLKFCKYQVAIIALLMLIFSFELSIYGILGRGYMMQSFFLIMAFIALIHILRNPTKKDEFNLWSVSCIVGFYTIPTFLYPFVGMVFMMIFYFILYKNKTGLINIFYHLSLIIGSVFLLYLPIILLCGKDALLENVYVISKSLKNLLRDYAQINEIFSFITDIPYKSYLLVGLMGIGGIIILVKKNHRKNNYQFIIQLVIWQIVGFFVVLLWKSIFPPTRVFVYAIFIWAIAITMLVDYFFKANLKKNIFIGLILIKLSLFSTKAYSLISTNVIDKVEFSQLVEKSKNKIEIQHIDCVYMTDENKSVSFYLQLYWLKKTPKNVYRFQSHSNCQLIIAFLLSEVEFYQRQGYNLTSTGEFCHETFYFLQKN